MSSLDCCPVMTLVLDRARPTDRIGMGVDQLFSLKTGERTREAIVLRFNKAPRGDKSEFANSMWAPVSFCPFCGKATP